jgi:putative colanic acid biosynthesis acetyltransferase WcaF
MKTNPAAFHSPHGRRNKAGRTLWLLASALLFRPAPWFLGAWRSWLLRRFGASLGFARLDRTVRVWAPWRLKLGHGVWVDEQVYFYNPFGISVGDRVVISRGSFLCSASHDHTDPTYGLIGGAIVIQDDCWIAADAFVGPGVTIGEGAVVGARAVVTKDVPPWTVVAGNPARVIKQRTLREGLSTRPPTTPATAENHA